MEGEKHLRTAPSMYHPLDVPPLVQARTYRTTLPREHYGVIMRVRCHARRSGAALVEFALVLPLFLLFVLALVEIGRGMMVTSLLTNAARSGCRAGVLSSAKNADVESAVSGRIKNMGLASPTVTITVNGAAKDVSAAQARDEIRVTVVVAYADVTWLPFTKWVSGNLVGQFTLPHE